MVIPYLRNIKAPYLKLKKRVPKSTMGLPHYFEYTMYCSTKGPVWLVPWTYNGILGNTLEFNINTIEYTMLQGFFFWSLLLKSVSRKLDPITVWLILCSLVQHITEELSLSLALPVEIFQACESPGEPQLQDEYEKYPDIMRREALQKNYPGEFKDYGYNATHAKHTSCSFWHERTVPMHLNTPCLRSNKQNHS